jgi:predicted transcriptional regulator
MQNNLDLLFGDQTRWKVIKMFIFSEKKPFSLTEVAKKNQLTVKKAQELLDQFIQAGFVIAENNRSEKPIFRLNEQFILTEELKKIVLKANTTPQHGSLEKIKALGKVHLALVGGIFVSDPRARVDLLIVAEKYSRARMRQLLDDLEAEVGREFNYSIMDSKEFRYRVNMFDRFILEIFEAPHQILINKVPGEIEKIGQHRRPPSDD